MIADSVSYISSTNIISNRLTIIALAHRITLDGNAKIMVPMDPIYSTY